MPDPEELKQFHDLAEEIKALGADSPEYKAFETVISQTDAMLSALSKKPKNGPVPVGSERNRSQLVGAHLMIGNAAEKLLGTEISEALKEKVRNLADLAAKNHRVLRSYQPDKEPKSLPRLLEDARTVTVDTRGTKLADSLSGAQSRRQPIVYMDDQGKKTAGVFTPKKVNDYWGDLQKIFEAEADDPRNALSQDAKDMLKGFLENYWNVFPQVVQYNRHGTLNKDPRGRRELDLTSMIAGISDVRTNKTSPAFLANAFKIAYPQLQGQDLNRVFGAGMMERLSQKTDPHFVSTGIQVDSAGIMDGSRTDTRNAAMYSMAELFGVSHLVAQAVPMKLIGENGEAVEGTFMMKAKGMDPENLPQEAMYINEDSLTGTNGKGYRDLADLQVLDYLCGNVDRHGGNMFYLFDRNHKFCGVQAIDNDCSCGLLVPSNKNNVNKLVVPKNMKIISRSMYDKVMTMQPEELRFALRGFGLSEKELNCSAKRLLNLKAELKKGAVTVVEDKDFRKINARKLSQLKAKDAQGNGLNLFTRASNQICAFTRFRMDQHGVYNDFADTDAIGEYNRALPGATDREIEKTDLLLQWMDRVTNTGFWHFHKGTSPQFEAMREAARNYKEYQQRIKARIDNANSPARKNDPDAPYDALVREEELEEMARLKKRMAETADTYLAGKGNATRNPYTRSRKEVAGFVKAFGQTGETVKEEEIQTLRKQGKRADEEAARRESAQQGPAAGL